MTSLMFDSLRYARRLRQSGMPEPQADAQAELMAESFGIIADKVLTKEDFEAVLRARLDAGIDCGGSGRATAAGVVGVSGPLILTRLFRAVRYS